MAVDDEIIVLVAATASYAVGRAGGRDASAGCWALVLCVNDNLGVYMRASNESRDLAA